MNELSLRLRVATEAPNEGIEQLMPYVDGVSLLELIDEFESDHGFDCPGGYEAVPTYAHGNLMADYLGQSDLWRGPGSTALLGCQCGTLGCWPLVAQVRVEGGRVAWEHFSQPHRPNQDYSGFGPFVFNEDQYRNAVEQARADLSG